MIVIVESEGRVPFGIAVHPFDKIREVKEKIQNILQIPVSYQIILFNDRLLEDHVHVLNTGIHPGSRILLYLDSNAVNLAPPPQQQPILSPCSQLTPLFPMLPGHRVVPMPAITPVVRVAEGTPVLHARAPVFNMPPWKPVDPLWTRRSVLPKQNMRSNVELEESAANREREESVAEDTPVVRVVEDTPVVQMRAGAPVVKMLPWKPVDPLRTRRSVLPKQHMRSNVELEESAANREKEKSVAEDTPVVQMRAGAPVVKMPPWKPVNPLRTRRSGLPKQHMRSNVELEESAANREKEESAANREKEQSAAANKEKEQSAAAKRKKMTVKVKMADYKGDFIPIEAELDDTVLKLKERMVGDLRISGAAIDSENITVDRMVLQSLSKPEELYDHQILKICLSSQNPEIYLYLEGVSTSC